MSISIFMTTVFDPNLSEDQYFQEHYEVHKKYQKLVNIFQFYQQIFSIQT